MDASQFNIEQTLIEEVKKRRLIYDKSLVAYTNNKARDRAWKEVAQVLNINDREILRKRWRSLRDSFIKIHRSLKNNPHQVKTKWIYYKRLTFLIPHLEHKDTRIGGSQAIKEEDDTTQDNDEKESFNDDLRYFSDEMFSDASSNSQIKTDGDGTKRMKMDKDEDPLLPTAKDSDEQFLLSCLPALKRLQPRVNAIARMRIQQVLFQIEFGNPEAQATFLAKEENTD
ncbi:transcription factor Adf-1-like [Asbolus verrucosus]|uniref:Transcription factor Adf-1-like n=1 Tax=Asbolus verrucosus TaxID=1661398 RepID=A0A482VPR7_ASBVE|nr:transcription factor Adf-1-like [Asbolus verrucosus]